MREELLRPGFNKTKLREATKFARAAYAAYERGRDGVPELTQVLAELGTLVGKKVGLADLKMAFGSVDPEEFAQGLVGAPVPSDLTETEMLELFEKILANPADSRVNQWLKVLETNTGDSDVTGLIFCTGSYFGHADDNAVELNAEEMLKTALAAGGKTETKARATSAKKARPRSSSTTRVSKTKTKATSVKNTKPRSSATTRQQPAKTSRTKKARGRRRS